nr:hemagglutinin repeat-containing protein [Acinetobacter seifertii]
MQQQWLNNSKGQILSGSALTFVGQDLINQGGLLQSGADLNFKLSGLFDNSQSGQLYSGGNTEIQAGSVKNSEQGKINAQGVLNIDAVQGINNSQGVMASTQQLSLKSQGLQNDGGQIGTEQGDVLIQTGGLSLNNGSGAIQSGKTLTLDVNGLNNSGVISALDRLTLNSQGDVTNDHGKLLSNKQLQLSSQNLSNQSGVIQSGAGSALDVVVNGTLDNSHAGSIQSGAALNLQVNALTNSQQGQISAQDALNIISAGLIDNETGSMVANQNISLSAQGLNNRQGQIGSIQGELSVDAGNQAVVNQSGLLQSKADLTVKALSLDSTAGQMTSQAKIDLQSQQEINNTQGVISADQGIEVNSQGLNNNLGQISSAQGNIMLNAGQGVLSNQTGKVIAGQALQLNASQVDNSQKGQLNSQTTLAIQTEKDINNQSGIIAANQQVNLNSQGLNNNQGQIASLHDVLTINSGSGSLDNESGILQAKGNIKLNADQVNSQSGLISSEDGIDVQSRQQVNNTAGQIVANNAVQIKSDGLNNNQGQIASIEDQLVLNAGTGVLSNQSGSLQSGKDIKVQAGQLKTQSGLINAQGSIEVTACQDIDNSSGQIIANKAVQLSSQGLTNNAGQIGSVEGTVSIDAGTGVLSNQQGKLQSSQDLTLKAQGIDNQSGLIATQAKLDMQQQWLNNSKGQILSGSALTFVGQDLINQGGLLQSGADLNFKLSGLFDNSQSGQLYSGGNTEIQAGSVKNSEQGKINAQGVLNIDAVQGINNSQGVMASTQQLSLKSQGLQNDGGQIGTEQGDVLIQTGGLSLNNGSGAIQSGKTLTLDVNGLNNSGVISALDRLTLNSQGDVTNDHGKLLSNKQLQLSSQNLSNQSGVIQSGAGSALDVVVNGTLDNSHAGSIQSGAALNLQVNALTNSQQGQISAQDALNIISAGLIDNETGSMVANQNISLSAQGLNNRQGQIGSIQGELSVDAGNQAVVNQSGLLQSKADLTVKALSLDSTAGQMTSQAKIDLQSQQEINNTQGVISADQGIEVNSQGLNNNLGQISSAQGNIMLNAGQGGATIAGRQAVEITADNVHNLNGRIQGNQVAIEAKKDLNNIGGQIIAKNAMALKVGGNLKVETTTRTSTSQVGGFGSSITGVDRIAGLYVGNGSTLQPNQATLVVDVAGNTLLKGAQIKNNNGATLFNGTGNIDIGAVNIGKQEKLFIDNKNGYQLKQQSDIGSEISSNGTLVISGQNITGKAVHLTSQQGDIQLLAQKDIQLDNGLKQSIVDSKTEWKGSFGGKKSSTYNAHETVSLANQLTAGQNIIINSQQGNITATHLQANAGNNIQIQTEQGAVNLLSAIDEKSASSTSSKKNTATYNNRQSGYIDQEVAQSTLKAGNSVDINAGQSIELQANNIQAGQNIYVGNTLMLRQADGTLKAADGSLMPKNVTLSTLETHDQQWDEQQKGYRGVAKELVKGLAIGLPGLQAAAPGFDLQKKITVGESTSQRTEQIRQIGSSLNAANIAIGSSGQTTLTSADLTAKNVALSGQKVTLNAAEEQNIESRSHSIETIEGLGAKLNKDSIRLGGFVSEKDKNTLTTTETTHKAGTINTDNLSIKGTEGVDVLGQNIKATGDTTIDHGRGELNIGGYENKTTTEEKTKNEKISTEVGVRNAYLDTALAVVAVKDAASALKDAKNAYSQAQRDYAAGKLTKEALDDSKANVAMATANLASAQIAVGASAAAAAASSATYGFTIGANGEHIETKTTTTTTQGQWQGSHLDLNNLTLKSEDQNANIQGSRLNATGTTTFNGTKDLNITAGIEHSSRESSSKTNNQSISYSSGGSGSASIGKQTSQSQSESLTHVNSEVALNRTEGQLNKLNIQGGEVSIADRSL